MADTLKEIYAGTLSVSDIATNGAATLATTDATTQYLIKDVEVNGTFVAGTSPVLTVNGFSVADLTGSATGSEIVDVSSTIKYQAFPSAPTLTSTALKLIYGTSGSFTYLDNLTYSINGVAASTTTNALSPITTNPSAGSYASTLNYARATDGSLFWVYWDGNSGTQLYKRTGGVNGSESTVVTLSYGWFVFNGVDTYYYANNGDYSLSKYNINTGATTTVYVGTTLSSTSYPSASLMNDGKILVNYSGNGQTSALLIVDPATGLQTNISGLTDVSVSGNTYKISGYYNAVTNRYTLYKRWSGTLYKTVLNGALTIGSAYSGGVTNTSYTINSIGNSNGNYNCGYVTCDSTNYSVAVHGVANKTDLATYNTATSTLSTASWLSYRTDMDTIIQNATASAAASNFTNTVKVRVTGVKSTI